MMLLESLDKISQFKTIGVDKSQVAKQSIEDLKNILDLNLDNKL